MRRRCQSPIGPTDAHAPAVADDDLPTTPLSTIFASISGDPDITARALGIPNHIRVSTVPIPNNQVLWAYAVIFYTLRVQVTANYLRNPLPLARHVMSVMLTAHHQHVYVSALGTCVVTHNGTPYPGCIWLGMSHGDASTLTIDGVASTEQERGN